MAKKYARLLKLADLLETKVPRKQFDMGVFAEGENFNKCGTSACACGWATTISSFKKAGFKLVENEFDCFIRYKNFKNFEAAAIFFNISIENAYELFDSFLRTPKQVAKHIRNFVKEKVS